MKYIVYFAIWSLSLILVIVKASRKENIPAITTICAVIIVIIHYGEKIGLW